MMRYLLFCLGLCLACTYGAEAQHLDGKRPHPVRWSYEAQKTGAGTYDLIFKAEITPGWAVYSQNIEEGGPVPTSLEYEENKLVSFLSEKAEEQGKAIEGMDEIFEMKLIKYKNSLTLVQKVKISERTQLKGNLTFMCCDESQCLPPVNLDFSFDLQ